MGVHFLPHSLQSARYTASLRRGCAALQSLRSAHERSFHPPWTLSLDWLPNTQIALPRSRDKLHDEKVIEKPRLRFELSQSEDNYDIMSAKKKYRSEYHVLAHDARDAVKGEASAKQENNNTPKSLSVRRTNERPHRTRATGSVAVPSAGGEEGAMDAFELCAVRKEGGRQCRLPPGKVFFSPPTRGVGVSKYSSDVSVKQ